MGWKWKLAALISVLVLLVGCQAELIEPNSDAVTLWVLTEKSYGMNAQAEEIIEHFQEQHKNITIDLEILPTEEEEREIRLERLRTEIMAGKGPDGYLLPTDYRAMESLFSNVEQTMYNGVFADISAYWAQEDGQFLSGINQTVLSAGVLDGRQYVLPLRYDLPVIYTDVAALQDLGMDFENLDMSISGFMEWVCQTESNLLAACSLVSSHNALGLFAPEYDCSSGSFSLDTDCTAEYFRAYAATVSQSWDIAVPAVGNLVQYINSGTSLGKDVPLKVSVLSALMDYTAIASVQEQELAVLPLLAVNGEYVANITYYAAVGANSAHPELVYAFLREFLTEEHQWEQNRRSVEFQGLTEEGWPIRDEGALEKLWKIYQAQHRNVYDGEDGIHARKQAILSLELTFDDFPAVYTPIDTARFPSRNEFTFFRESLIQVTDPAFSGNYEAVAEELVRKIQRSFAEG